MVKRLTCEADDTCLVTRLTIHQALGLHFSKYARPTLCHETAMKQRYQGADGTDTDEVYQFV